MRRQRLTRLVGDIHPENRGMQQMCKRLGFRLNWALGDTVRAELEL